METAYRPHVTTVEPETHLEAVTDKNVSSSDVSELYHERSKLDRRGVRTMNRTFARLESPSMQYFQRAIAPDYREAERIDLPEPEAVETDLATVLADRRSRRQFADEGVTRQQLSTTLGHACGVSETVSRELLGIDVTDSSRTYPSAGALYPIETYLFVLDAPDVASGIYYYRPDDHCLRVCARAEDHRLIDAFCVPLGEWNASVVVVLTASFWRSKAKYGQRAYRYCLQESGHVAQNVQLVGLALGIDSVPLAAFYDERVNDLLDVDGVNEAVVHTVAMGNAGAAEP